MNEKAFAIETIPSVFDEQDPTDAQLLARFVDQRDQTAFEALLLAHGPMVFGVCHRILMRTHDAEDAFQATFLSLSQNAHRIGRAEFVANWLYTVASRMAIKLKKMASKRRQVELQLEYQPSKVSESNLDQDERWSDLAPILDREIGRLSDNLRAAVILCDVEGKTRQEAGRQLGCPEATVSTRLMKARSLLAQRLKRRGVALSTATLGALLLQNAASAAMPASLVETTLQTASAVTLGQTVTASMASPQVIALTNGTWKSMLLANLKIVATALGLFATAGLALQIQAEKQPEKQPEQPIAIQVANVPEQNGSAHSAIEVLRKCLATQSTRNRIRAKVTCEIQQGRNDDVPSKIMSQCIFIRSNNDYSVSARVRCSGQDESALGIYYDTGWAVKDGTLVTFQEWEEQKRQKAMSPSISHGDKVTTSDPAAVADRTAKFLGVPEFGAFLDGFVVSNFNKTLVEWMLEGEIGKYEPDVQIDGVDCYLINASTKVGDIALWVSHAGYQVLQFDCVKSPQHWFGGSKGSPYKLADQPPNRSGQRLSKWSTTLRDVKLTTINGVDVPTQGTLQNIWEYQGGRSVREGYSVSRTDVALSDEATNSDHFDIDTTEGSRSSDFAELVPASELIWDGAVLHKPAQRWSNSADPSGSKWTQGVWTVIVLNGLLLITLVGVYFWRRRRAKTI